VAIVVAAQSGCGTVTPITNHEPVAVGAGYQSQYRSRKTPGAWAAPSAINSARCQNDDAPASYPLSAMSSPAEVEHLSQGDIVDVRVGVDDMLSGSFKVSDDGAIRLPDLPSVQARGRTVDEIERDIAEHLVRLGLYRSAPSVSVRVTDTAAARVYVSGAVFEPGTVVVGGVSGRDIDVAREKASGWTALDRRLSRALQSAGGVRPDADLARVSIWRGATRLTVDMRPAIAGKPYQDLILLAGDRIEVASRGCFQDALMVPSAITAAGIKVYMSNLTQPAANNANSAIGKETQDLRYGTRFMQAMVGMNCVGGARQTNADRSVVLFTHNPVTGESIVVSRRIEDLVARADRDAFNPYLLPGDALACYDSHQTNVLAIANAFGSIISSAIIASRF
jgi:protein involved in polysaccharide export with SLBB domain